MNRAPEISITDLLSELAKIPPAAGPEGATIRELTAAMGLQDTKYARETVCNRLRPLVAAGKVRCQQGKRPGITGAAATVPVYSIVKGKR